MAGTVRKHHPRGQDKYLEMYREGQAKLEWEKKQRLMKEIKDKLCSLPVMDRLEILGQFCVDCGSDQCTGCVER